MRHVDTFPHSVTEHADWGIIMPDECRLSARIWMPDDASADNPVPVILEHLPYRKRDGTIERDQFTHPWFAGHGYCCIRTDMRGNGDSEGLMNDEYTAQELQDACDVIAWAASQPWCNGHVGMMGISWGGFNGLQVAALTPPALKAVITICSTVDRYADDIHYKGGCLLGENFGWAANMLSYSSRPPDAALRGESWKDMWLERLDNIPWHWSQWMRHQHRDAYWQHGSVCEDYIAINAAVLTIGGWHDGYRNTIAHLVENLDAPVKGIVGPWNHKYPHYAGPKPAIGFLQEAKRWWDHWLKGEERGVEKDPDMRLYLMDSVAPQRWFDERPGRWIADQDWPFHHIQSLVLKADQTLEQSEGNEPDAFSVSVSSPQTCGTQSGEYFPFAFSDELPGEQTADDEKSLCFDGSETQADQDIVGAPRVRLKLTSNRQNGVIAVRLCDLRPDGTSALITHGVFNLTHRASHAEPEALVPGKAFDITFALDQIAYRLPAGHRLRLAISTAYWPYIWPSPETAEITVLGGSLALPVRPLAEEAEWEFEEPEGAPAWKRDVLREGHYRRSVETDADTGETRTIIDCDFGEYRDADHGLISGSTTRECWSIKPDNPLSARSEIVWTKKGGRDGAMWTTDVVTTMWCDDRHFYSSVKLVCTLEGETVFDRVFEDKVERQLV